MNFIKRFIIAIAIILTFNISAYAQPMISDIGVYRGKLFYCDTIENKIALVDVTPVKENPTKKDKQTALSAEYEAIPFSGASIHLNGESVSFEDANHYADSDVVAIIAHTSEGLRVLSIEIK